MPNLTNALQYVDLSTNAAIIAKMDISDAGDSRTTYIDSVIQEVSSSITEYLGVHTLVVERTERYTLRQFSKMLTLDAPHLTGTTTVKVAASPSDLSSATADTEDTDYWLDSRSGTVTFIGDQPYAPAHCEVTYTGGYFANTGELGMKHQWLTDAAELQILYRLQRQDALGGNVDTVAGQGTNFSQGSYGLLPIVRNMLRMHRRVVV